MQRRTFMTAAAAIALAGPARAAAAQPQVLELFTSEGCSSCPPADALLGTLARQPGVIALAWHVDYWNNLGWRDPFASRFATDRQRAYAARLRDEVYTPALVVNGAAIVVGSDRGAIATAMARSAVNAMPLGLQRGANSLRAEVAATPASLTALLAFYDPEQSTPIGAGENEGRRLREYRVVRSVHAETLPAGPARALELPLPPAGQGAVLLLQDADLRVLAAADLAPASPQDANKTI